MNRSTYNIVLELHPSSADLIRDRFGTIFESKRVQPKEFTPNIDNPLLSSDTIVENLLHSYFMLFCRRCHRYDCFLHKDKPIIPDLKNRSRTSNIIYRPCSSYCYRRKPLSLYKRKRIQVEFERHCREPNHNQTLTMSTNGFYSKRTKSNVIKSKHTSLSNSSNFCDNGFLYKPSLKRNLNNELSNWLSSDRSLFRVFHTIFDDNICMIAQLLGKPCSHVYTFYSNENVLFSKWPLATTTALKIETFSTIPSNQSKNSKDRKTYTNNDEQLMDDEVELSNDNNNRPSVRIYFQRFNRFTGYLLSISRK